MLAYLGEAESHDAQLVTNARVERGAVLDDERIELVVGGDEPIVIVARHVINAAGLWAQTIATRLRASTLFRRWPSPKATISP